MFQVINKTPFIATLMPSVDRDGTEDVIVIAKGTFQIPKQGVPQPLPEQLPITMADEYYDDPETTSLRYASDIVPEKQGTDVVLIGCAYPRGGTSEHVDVTLQVGPLNKTVRAFGKRHWKRSLGRMVIGDSQLTETMPLVYENAFGGKDETDADERKWSVESRNPIGKGLVSNLNRDDLEGVELPNLEDPEAPIQGHSDRPAPVGFGFIGRTWQPRLSYAGTYDAEWEQSRCPLLPDDFNPRFYNAAHPDLISSNFFQGGEQVTIINASQNGSLDFRLPEVQVESEFFINGAAEKKSCVLDTVIIEPDENRLLLTWRTKVACHRKMKYVLGAKVTARFGGE